MNLRFALGTKTVKRRVFSDISTSVVSIFTLPPSSYQTVNPRYGHWIERPDFFNGGTPVAIEVKSFGSDLQYLPLRWYCDVGHTYIFPVIGRDRVEYDPERGLTPSFKPADCAICEACLSCQQHIQDKLHFVDVATLFFSCSPVYYPVYLITIWGI
ncbi:hypothetical protein K438DRAFT_1765765 [Mycena galopus ATCC 62051]|nr:hypothetical protein K438DRAFT_1765765 [Mycena galopus ATCC 62051]